MKDALLMGEISRIAYIKKPDGSPDEALILQELKSIDQKFERVTGFNRKSTQCIIAEHHSFTVIAFRGTDEILDWLDNLDFTTIDKLFGHFHAGFWKACADVYHEIKAYTNNLQVKPLYLTGHSLGGALATVYAARMLYDLKSVEGVYTFGQPRVMKKNAAVVFNKFLKDRFYRFQNNSDIITRAPSMMIGYRHVGQHFYINRKGKMKRKPGFMYKFIDCLKDMFESALIPGIEIIEDHDIKRYISALK